MVQKQIVYAANRKATEVFKSSGAQQRIEQDGYTRVDPFKIAASEGVAVLLRPLKKLLGAFLRSDTPGILINVERSAGMIHMTCAHELGHFFFGHQNAADETLDYGADSNRQELEADWFAYQLLAPRILIAKVLRQKQWTIVSLKNPAILYQFSLRLGVSYTAAAWSLFRHNLIDHADVQKLIRVAPADIKRSIIGSKIGDARSDTWILDDNDKLSILEPRAADNLIVRLKSHASAGYLWSADEVKGEGFIIEPLTIETNTPIKNPSEIVVGQQQLLDYRVVQAPPVERRSPTPLYLSERKPWSGDEPAYSVYSSRILFEKLDAGLTAETKQKLLQENLGI